MFSNGRSRAFSNEMSNHQPLVAVASCKNHVRMGYIHILNIWTIENKICNWCVIERKSHMKFSNANSLLYTSGEFIVVITKIKKSCNTVTMQNVAFCSNNNNKKWFSPLFFVYVLCWDRKWKMCFDFWRFICAPMWQENIDCIWTFLHTLFTSAHVFFYIHNFTCSCLSAGAVADGVCLCFIYSFSSVVSLYFFFFVMGFDAFNECPICHCLKHSSGLFLKLS